MTARSPITPRPLVAGGDVHITVARCKGCELCIECCPTGVLSRSDDYNAAGYHYPVWTGEGCIDCNGCYTICPEYAIFSTPLSGATPLRTAPTALAVGA